MPDAGEAAAPRVDLHLEYGYGALRGEVRDYGRGFDPDRTLLPATSLFNSGKPGGLGVGLALSHATVEQLGGEMTMTAAEDGHPHPFLSASRHIRDLTMNPTDLGLLIDDDELYVRTLQRSLSRRGLKPAPPPASPRRCAAEEIRPAFALVDLRLGEDCRP